jgi:hypothetical protein
VDLLRNRYGDMDKMGASQIAVVIAAIIGYNSQIAFCAGRLRRSVGQSRTIPGDAKTERTRELR